MTDDTPMDLTPEERARVEARHAVATSASGQPARTARVRSRSFCGKPRMAERWAIKVVWSDGEEEYLKEGIRVAIFSSRSRAHEQADFMKIGMDDVQSIAVVKAPRG